MGLSIREVEPLPRTGSVGLPLLDGYAMIGFADLRLTELF